MKRSAFGRCVSITLVCAVFVLLLPLGQVVAAPATVTPIYDIQFTTDPSGNSPLQYQDVTIEGVVTATDYDGYVVADGAGAWNAVYIASYYESVALGDEVRLSGWVDEYYGLTIIVDVVGFELLSSDNPVEATTVGVADASQEMYEAVLITVEDVEVAALLDYGEWAVTDVPPSAFLLVDDLNDYVYFPSVGDRLDSLTGFLTYTFGDFKLEPRFTADISGDPIPHYALHGTVVTMNDSRDILLSGYVEVVGDQIVSVGRRRPAGVRVVYTRGLIFPGLVDAHNHPFYNVLGPIPFGQLYTERYEWQADPMYDVFNDQLYGMWDYGGYDAQVLNILKYGEVRALTAGTTVIQGIPFGYEFPEIAHQGIVINNVERFPGNVLDVVRPLTYADWEWQDYISPINFDRFLIHLSEGTSAASLDEFYTWVDWGMLDWRTTIIHGVPYGPAEWDMMAAADANLVWSPVSNMTLYGATADVPGALAAGVNVALSPDWTPSGSLDLLDEMKAANRINQEQWGGVITPRQFAEFVTRNAAKAAGIDHFAGQIAPGYRANLAVFAGPRLLPYRALLLAEQKDVKLTVVDGKPMYGNPALMWRFDFLDDLEYVRIDGRFRALAIQVDAHAIAESDKPFLEIEAELEAAYAAAEPKLCAFAGLDGYGPQPPALVITADRAGAELQTEAVEERRAASWEWQLDPACLASSDIEGVDPLNRRQSCYVQ